MLLGAVAAVALVVAAYIAERELTSRAAVLADAAGASRQAFPTAPPLKGAAARDAAIQASAGACRGGRARAAGATAQRVDEPAAPGGVRYAGTRTCDAGARCQRGAAAETRPLHRPPRIRRLDSFGPLAEAPKPCHRRPSWYRERHRLPIDGK